MPATPLVPYQTAEPVPQHSILEVTLLHLLLQDGLLLGEPLCIGFLRIEGQGKGLIVVF